MRRKLASNKMVRVLTILLVFLMAAGMVEKSMANIEQKIDTEDLLKSTTLLTSLGYVSLDEEAVVTVRVGDICFFYEREVQSWPNRWKYLISDETLIRVSSDNIIDMSGSNTLPGGDNAYRSIEFVAIAPGESMLSFRNSQYGHTDWDDAFLSERIYHIVITE